MENPKKFLKKLMFAGKPFSLDKNESPNKNRWSLGKAFSCMSPGDDDSGIRGLQRRDRKRVNSVREHVSASLLSDRYSQSERFVKETCDESLQADLATSVESHNDRDVCTEDDCTRRNIDEETCKKEKAAIIIQAAYRKFLHQRTFIAIRNAKEHKDQTNASQLRCESNEIRSCVQDVAKEQTEVSIRKARYSEERKAIPMYTRERRVFRVNNGKVQDEWDNSTVTYDELQARIRRKQEAAARREKALAYASLQQLRISAPQKNQTSNWNWVERWMAARPIESSAEVTHDAYLNRVQNEKPQQYDKKRKKTSGHQNVPCSTRLTSPAASTVKLSPPAKKSLSKVQQKSDTGRYDNQKSRKVITKSGNSKIKIKNQVPVEREGKHDLDQNPESCDFKVMSLGSLKGDSSKSSLDSQLLEKKRKPSRKCEPARLQTPRYISTSRTKSCKL